VNSSGGIGIHPRRRTTASFVFGSGSLDIKTESGFTLVGSNTDSSLVSGDITIAPSSPFANDSSSRRNSMSVLIPDMSLSFFYISLNATINSGERPIFQSFLNLVVLHWTSGSIHDRSLIFLAVSAPTDTPDFSTNV